MSNVALLETATRLAQIQLCYANQGTNLARAAMAGSDTFEEMRHYPSHDVVDQAAGTRFYYHAHRSRRMPDTEHGHFHLFVYNEKQPDNYYHLAALALDARGQPLRWFTTNRWVTGERWQNATRIERELSRFQIQTRGRMAPVANWLTGMVQLFSPQLANLVRRRDTVMARHFAKQDLETVFEDRYLDVITECPASLPKRILQLGR